MSATIRINGVLQKKIFNSEEAKRAHTERTYHPPTRTFKELSEELGVSMQTLRCMLRRSPNAPKSTVKVGSTNGSNGRSYYAHAAFIKWFHEQRKEKENGN